MIADDFRNGHFVIDGGTELPEATEVELQLIKVADAFADMPTEGCEELEEAIEEGYEIRKRRPHRRPPLVKPTLSSCCSRKRLACHEPRVQVGHLPVAD